MRTIFITARTSSSRLPGKCLKNVAPNQKSISFLIERLQGKNYELILCTSKNSKDDRLADVGRSHGIKVFRGEEKDKLKRWLDCAEENHVRFFVTADGDDLFVEPELIDLAFLQNAQKGHEFINCPDTPSGSFSWGIATDALRRVYDAHPGEENTEMGWCWFDNVHKLENVPMDFLRRDVRMTLDYPEDLLFFKKVIEAVGNAPLRTILQYLDANKDVVLLNIARESDFKNNQEKLIEKIK